MYNKKHLTILLIDGAQGHTHAHTDTQKEMDPEVFIAPSARKEDELKEENVLATWPMSSSARMSYAARCPHLPRAPVTKGRTRAAESRGGETR